MSTNQVPELRRPDGIDEGTWQAAIGPSGDWTAASARFRIVKCVADAFDRARVSGRDLAATLVTLAHATVPLERPDASLRAVHEEVLHRACRVLTGADLGEVLVAVRDNSKDGQILRQVGRIASVATLSLPSASRPVTSQGGISPTF